ncbi:hypothetical protein Glove_144g52 [Diversispora epigaea]|uniref:Uncharacterized protein n=1 Tax=Diversispora epigaea TaxID=1348612 RepID=A0A397J3M1_9GLOM|nr:hypothetical protein Glove_144g52 [Diversispora epigaea]
MATLTNMESKSSFRIQNYKKNENVSMNGSISTQLKFDKIHAKIEQKLEGEYSGIIKINFPAGELSDLKVCEDIHNAFNAEIIGDNLFIKCDGGEKERIHTRLENSFESQNQWWASSNTLCVVRGNQYRPDVGVWFRAPTLPQRRMPIVFSCPPPNVWIEVFYNIDSDRSYAFKKINFLQQNTTGIEFVAIGLSSGLNPFHPKPETEMKVHATSQVTRPARAPYVCHWDLNLNEIWYKMDWNQFITLRCGLTISFDIVFQELLE